MPVGLKEGDTVIAVALAEDGSRLYLRARLELPLLPKRLEMTHTPDMYVVCVYVYISNSIESRVKKYE